MPATWHACTCLARVRATKPDFSSKFQFKLFITITMRSLCDKFFARYITNSYVNY